MSFRWANKDVVYRPFRLKWSASKMTMSATSILLFFLISFYWERISRSIRPFGCAISAYRKGDNKNCLFVYVVCLFQLKYLYDLRWWMHAESCVWAHTTRWNESYKTSLMVTDLASEREWENDDDGRGGAFIRSIDGDYDFITAIIRETLENEYKFECDRWA